MEISKGPWKYFAHLSSTKQHGMVIWNQFSSLFFFFCFYVIFAMNFLKICIQKKFIFSTKKIFLLWVNNRKPFHVSYFFPGSFIQNLFSQIDSTLKIWIFTRAFKNFMCKIKIKCVFFLGKENSILEWWKI